MDFVAHAKQLKDKIVFVILSLTFFCSFSLLSIGGLLTYWLYYPYTPLVIEKLEVSTNPKIGEAFVYKLTYQKNMCLSARVIRQVVDSGTWTLPDQLTNMPITSGTTHSESFIMPKLPESKYKFRWTAIYKPNPIREVVITAESKEFTLGG